MKANILFEGVSTIKIRPIKKAAQTIYDGDPRGHEGRPSTARNQIAYIDSLLGKIGRRFDRLLLAKKEERRWFIAVSYGSPEVFYYFSYDTSGFDAYLYVDWLKVKMKDFLTLSPEDQVKVLSKTTDPDPAAIWRKERSIDLVANALELLDHDAANKSIDLMQSKLLNAILNMDISESSITKLASFVNSLMNIKTPKAVNLAKTAIETYKNLVIKDILVAIKHDKRHISHIKYEVKLLKKSGFNWPDLDIIEKSLKADKT